MGYYLPETAFGQPNLTAKNRVWGFFGESVSVCLETRRSVLEPHQENYDVSRKAASGIPLWPSRDPIGERGGLNLYGFVYNNTNYWIDVLGRNPEALGAAMMTGDLDAEMKIRGDMGEFDDDDYDPEPPSPQDHNKPKKEVPEAPFWTDCEIKCFKKAGKDFLLGGAIGGGAQGANKTARKPRTGAAGGGPSKGWTSWSRKLLGPSGKSIGRATVSKVATMAALAYSAPQLICCLKDCADGAGDWRGNE